MPQSRSRSKTAVKPETLDEFLAAPPEGTPAEVIEAFEMTASATQGVLSPRLFFEIVQQSPLAISITDEEANILYVNPAFETLTAYDKDAILGKNESILSHKQTPIAVYRELWSTIRAKKPWRGTLVNRRSTSWKTLDEQVRKSMDAESALAAILAQPTLVKRPLLDTGAERHTGFSAANYEKIFSAHTL